MRFSDRIKLVAGAHPYSWAADHGFTKSGMNSLLICEKPQRKTLEKLVAATGIPADWWLHGDGPPPALDESLMQPALVQNVRGADKTMTSTASILATREKQSPYVVRETIPGPPGSAIKAESLSFSISFATRALMAAQAAEWMPKGVGHDQIASLVTRLFYLLLDQVGGNEEKLARLVESDAALEAALRFVWELERLRT